MLVEVFYHKGCNDGTSAAIAAYQYLATKQPTDMSVHETVKNDDDEIVAYATNLFVPQGHNDPINITYNTSDLWFVDFTPTYKELKRLGELVKGTDRKVVIFDHHETGIKELAQFLSEVPAGGDRFYYYMNKSLSGAECVNMLNMHNQETDLDQHDNTVYISKLCSDYIRSEVNMNHVTSETMFGEGFKASLHWETVPGLTLMTNMHEPFISEKYEDSPYASLLNDEEPAFDDEFNFLSLIATRDLWKPKNKHLADCLSAILWHHEWNRMSVDKALGFITNNDLNDMIETGGVLVEDKRVTTLAIIDKSYGGNVDNTVSLGVSFNPELPSSVGAYFCQEKHGNEPAVFVSVSYLPNTQSVELSLRSNDKFQALWVVDTLKLSDIAVTGGGHKQACGCNCPSLYDKSPREIIDLLNEAISSIIEVKFTDGC